MQFVRETATIFAQTITGTLTVYLVPQEEIVPLTGDNAHTPLPHLSLSLSFEQPDYLLLRTHHHATWLLKK